MKFIEAFFIIGWVILIAITAVKLVTFIAKFLS